MAEGAFEHLCGHGRPLDLKDESHIPEDLRMAYKILKNAGYLPREVELQKQISSTRDLLKSCRDEQEKIKQLQKLNLLVTRMNMQRKVPVNLEENQAYFEKVVNRVKIKSK